jgi:tRNA(Ser,Leu) C12 N-acetylase TAN1
MMRDWNVVATVRGDNFSRGRRFLERFGDVAATDYYNTLVARVPDHARFLEELRDATEREPEEGEALSRVIPSVVSFTFRSPAEFEEKARTSVSAWIPSLAGKAFHVRMRRRGFRGRLSSMEEEKFLDGYLLEALETYGNPGRIDFTDADAVIAIETVGDKCGMSFWTREDMQRNPLLRVN